MSRRGMVVVLAASLFACGGKVVSVTGNPDSGRNVDAGAEPNFVACGGSLHGTWVVSHAYLIREPVPAPGPCPGRVTLSWSPVAGGWVTFRGDGSMTSASSIGNDQVSVVPLSCSHAADCNALQHALSGPAMSTSCVASGASACRCSQTLTPVPVEPMNMPYSVEGGYIWNGTTAIPYCVQGDVLDWQVTLSNTEVVQLEATRQ